MSESVSFPSQREIYSRAPVMEAAIDIRCTNRPNFTVADVALLAEDLAEEFRQEGEIVEKREEVRADGARRITERPLGLVLRRFPDERAVLQLQVEGFTWSHVAPYDRWERFRDDAKGLWSRYVEAAHPQVVTRIAVRYINRLELGEVIDDLRPFLRVYPVTPWELQAPPSGFSLQVRIPREMGEVLVVNVATVRHAQTRQIGVLLDLDAYVQVDMSSELNAVWNVVERLHVTVEEAFEALITDRVRELIR
jgi:uncharacterized protein (TIGR04255 family)